MKKNIFIPLVAGIATISVFAGTSESAAMKAAVGSHVYSATNMGITDTIPSAQQPYDKKGTRSNGKMKSDTGRNGWYHGKDSLPGGQNRNRMPGRTGRDTLRNTMPPGTGTPGTPGNPGYPGTPSTPGTMGNPATPGTMGTPGNPGYPNTPGSTGTPGLPANPATPGTPGVPATPTTPVVPRTTP